MYGGKELSFCSEFKRSAPQILTEKGMPMGKVAWELELHQNLLRTWSGTFSTKGDI